MKKYKFILTLDEYTTFDSAVELEGLVNWPNYSQPYPEHYRGVFDTYEEAKEYAANFWLYKRIMNDGYAEYLLLYLMQRMLYAIPYVLIRTII